MSSSGSLHELHTTSSGEGHVAVPLAQIVSVWRLEDGRPYFSIEINHYDEGTNVPGSWTLQLHDPREYDLWMSSIRGAVIKTRLCDTTTGVSQNLTDHTVRIVEQENDYDPLHFNIWKVTQRAGKASSRSSSEDLTKLTSSICMLAIGTHKVHLIPVPPRTSGRLSSTSLSDVNGVCHGMMTLTQLHVNDHDDAFSLTFRLPLRRGSTLTLASCLVNDIALQMRHRIDHLRPRWALAPFTWNVPKSIDELVWPIPGPEEPYDCLIRTMSAYCVSYGVNPSSIIYTIEDQGEDGPAFQLRPPVDKGRTRYTALEMLAILRSLRYNESFTTLSFQYVSFDVLHNVRDRYGHDHAPETTKSGEPLNIVGQLESTLLIQEVRALAVKSRRLRRLDFSHCLNKSSSKDGDNPQDPGCGICEALFPLCEKQWTNIDWVVLNGIHLTDIDIDYLFAAALNKSCHLRGLELGHCGLVDRSIQTVLQAISNQAATLESIDLSGNLARHNPQTLQNSISPLEFLRKVNLSHINRTTGSEALLSGETLRAWKLTELRLSRTSLNQATVESLAQYLIDDHSDYLRRLEINRCGLTGGQAATLLNAMDRGAGNARNLYLNLSENYLEQQHDLLVDAVGRSCTPYNLSMQMLEYKSEENFQKLLEAFTRNDSTAILDISKTALQNDAGDVTCELLRQMFERNHTIEELNICGEHSHLEAANYGSGINKGLLGIMWNTSLRILRVEYQKLGLQGASTLASVLGVNRTLQQLHVENNEINLQAFTVLVNALKDNTTILYLSSMENDRAWTQWKVDKEIENIRDPNPNTVIPTTVNRTLGRALGKSIGGATRSVSGRGSDKAGSGLPKYSETDMKSAMGSLSQNWDRETAKLHEYLRRNNNLYHGISNQTPDDLDGPPKLVDVARPGTSESLATALRKIEMDDKTPVAEVERQLVIPNESPDSEHDNEDVGEEGEMVDSGILEMKEHSHV